MECPCDWGLWLPKTRRLLTDRGAGRVAGCTGKRPPLEHPNSPPEPLWMIPILGVFEETFSPPARARRRGEMTRDNWAGQLRLVPQELMKRGPCRSEGVFRSL